MQRENHMHCLCSRAKGEGERGTIAQDGLCDKARERYNSFCSVDLISDWEIIEIGMLPGQVYCCCSKERV